MAIHYAIDSVATNGQMIFGWGWCFSDRSEHAEIQLRFEHGDGNSTWLKCQALITRVDVLEAYPNFQQSVRSGFRFSATIELPLGNPKVFLYLRTHDGQWENTELLGFLPSGNNVLEAKATARNEKKALRHFFAQNSAEPMPKTILLIDHAMGGGANLVSERWAQQWIEAGCAVLALRFNTTKLRYELHYRHADRNESVSASVLKHVIQSLDKWQFSRIEVNSLVTFPEVYALLNFVVRQRNKKNCSLAYYCHDFHALCDSWSLIDQHDDYCGLPTAVVCQKCIRQRPEIFPSLQNPSSIIEWRQHWKKFLMACDVITFFSDSSRLLFGQVYKNTLADDKCRVIPHEPVSELKKMIEPAMRDHFVVGVVGNISIAKGAKLLRDMARLILRENLPLKIVVVGNVETYEPSDAYFSTGSYKRHEVPSLLEHHCVGLCFLPSLCPETFSFVVSEIMQLELPLLCFNVGAQAERVSRYERGLVVDDATAEAALAAIVSFLVRKRAQKMTTAAADVVDFAPTRVLSA